VFSDFGKFKENMKNPIMASVFCTFPFVISAIASKQLMACSAAMESPMGFLKPIVLAETVIATITTLYALVRYLMFLFGNNEKKAA
jgi:exfoliative toxin A/B